MKQTAVEFLIEQISSSKYFYNLMEELESRSTTVQPNGILHKAKEIEKEQIVSFVDNLIVGMSREKIEKYYNETFKKD